MWGSTFHHAALEYEEHNVLMNMKNAMCAHHTCVTASYALLASLALGLLLLT